MPTRWFDGPTDGAGTSGLDARCRGAACGVRKSAASGGPAAGEAWPRPYVRSHMIGCGLRHCQVESVS